MCIAKVPQEHNPEIFEYQCLMTTIGCGSNRSTY